VSSKEDLAVIETGSKQYIVKEGDVISVEKLNTDGKDVTFDTVLLVKQKGKVTVGAPNVDFTVKAEVLGEEKDKKVRVFKFKKKTGYKKTQGHRQDYTTVRIKSIAAKKAAATKAKKETASKDEKKETKKASESK